MKEKLLQLYQYLNIIGVIGQPNVFAMANAMQILQELIAKENDKEQEREQPATIDNTQDKKK